MLGSKRLPLEVVVLGEKYLKPALGRSDFGFCAAC